MSRTQVGTRTCTLAFNCKWQLPLATAYNHDLLIWGDRDADLVSTLLLLLTFSSSVYPASRTEQQIVHLPSELAQNHPKTRSITLSIILTMLEDSRFIPGISVEPPTDPHAPEMERNQGYVNICFLRVAWLTEARSSDQDGSLFAQGYPSGSAPRGIAKINTQSHTLAGSLANPGGIWEARSPAFSESGFSNPSSPVNQYTGELSSCMKSAPSCALQL